MKMVYYGLATVALVLLAINLYQLISAPVPYILHTGSLLGFTDGAETDPAYTQLIDAFSKKIAAYREDVEKFRDWGVWASLTVTALTALSTLLTTLKAAKSAEAVTGKFMQGIAILAFLSTLSSWGNTQLSDRKSQADQSLQKCRDTMTAFYTAYDNAKDPAAKAQQIRLYEIKLADL